MQRVLSNEPVIKYRDFFTYSTLTQPETSRGAYSIGLMDDAIVIVSTKYWFCLSSWLINVILMEPWQHAGLVPEGS